MSEDAQDLLLGRYRLGRQLGEGGMGAVYEGVQVGLERRVAIKMLLPELVSNPELAARFKREAEMVARLNHPHIVQISDFGVHAGKPVMVMEYLEGETLREYLGRSAPLSLEQTMAVAAPILRALSAAHAAGVVHRDVKPENIFLVWDEELPIPKLLDFGIAKTEHVERITKTQSTIGTALYMAPEQVRSSKNVGPACDQYAMGVVLYEMLTGAFPHEGETGPQLAVAKLTEAPRPMQVFRKDLPPHVVDAVMRTLELEPEKRFADVAELRRVLSTEGAVPAGVIDERAKTMLPQTTGDVDVEGATLPPKSQTPEIEAPADMGAAATGPTMPAIATPAAPIAPPVIEPQSPEPRKPIPQTAPPRAVAAQAVATPLPAPKVHPTPAPHLVKTGSSKSTQWMRGAVTALIVAGAGGLLVVGLFVALRSDETVASPVATTPRPSTCSTPPRIIRTKPPTT